MIKQAIMFNGFSNKNTFAPIPFSADKAYDKSGSGTFGLVFSDIFRRNSDYRNSPETLGLKKAAGRLDERPPGVKNSLNGKASCKAYGKAEEVKRDVDSNCKKPDCKNTVEYLSALLGMTTGEFITLAEYSGITVDELIAGDVESISEKISSAAGFSALEKDMLLQKLNLAKEKLSEFYKNDMVSGSDLAADEIILVQQEQYPEHVFAEIALSDGIPGQITKNIEINDITKLVLESALSKLRLKLSGREATPAAVNGGEAAILSGAGLGTDIEPVAGYQDVSGNGLMTGQTDGIAEKKAGQSDADTGGGQHGGEAGYSGENPFGTELTESVASEGDNGAFINPAGLTQFDQNGVKFIDSISKNDAIQPKEIISQIVEKVKVTLSPEKTEMLLDLKPESLGKLSVKVVTERGMVVAKFIAENEQVKQILESGMQQLKDSLEKQGVGVQAFYVSVGQEGSPGSSSHNRYHESGSRTKYSGMRESVDAVRSEGPAIGYSLESNRSIWSNSTINLIA